MMKKAAAMDDNDDKSGRPRDKTVFFLTVLFQTLFFELYLLSIGIIGVCVPFLCIVDFLIE